MHSRKFYLIVFTTAILQSLLAVGCPAVANETPIPPYVKTWGPATPIDTNNTYSALSPQIVSNASGVAFAVWCQIDDGSHYSIWTNRYIPGSGWGTAALLETDNTKDAGNPQIACDASGNAFAVWQHREPGSSYTICTVWAKRFNADSGWDEASLIELDNTEYAQNPQIICDASGNALVVWTQYNGIHQNIVANRYVAGTGWSTTSLVETDDVGEASYPRIDCDASGNAFAVWMRQDGTHSGIWANRYNAGTGWATAYPIAIDNVGGANFPQIACDASGNAFAVWFQHDGTCYSIYANRFVSVSGWGMASLIETINAGDAQNPQIACDASGNAFAVWQQIDGTRTDVWANRYVAGSGWATAFLLETDNLRNAGNPQIACDASGNAFAVWFQYDGTRSVIWAKRYSAGTGWGTATPVMTDNTGDAGVPQISCEASGNALAVWQQSDGTRNSIWANTYR